MRKPVTLITGANGEIGHGLIEAMAEQGKDNIIGLDIDRLDEPIRKKVQDAVSGDVLDKNLLHRINAEYEISELYHLAAVLSTRAEFSPMTAHDVNVGGMINLLRLAMEQALTQGKPVKFFFPSSIAIYGLPDLESKNSLDPITEDEYRHPQTMYGCNKLHCENLGIYFSRFYKRLSAESSSGLIDFRVLRFPGLISAFTLPSGGTTDYGPEMIHAAAMGKPYSCFVRADTRLPFMTMSDAIRAVLTLMESSKQSLRQPVYHVKAFAPSAQDFREKILCFFPDADITFQINDKRQSIVDSWPANIDDTAARQHWGWSPEYDFDSAFEDYLVPEIRNRYGG